MLSNNSSILFWCLAVTMSRIIRELMQKLNILGGGNFKFKVRGAEYFLRQQWGSYVSIL